MWGNFATLHSWIHYLVSFLLKLFFLTSILNRASCHFDLFSRAPHFYFKVQSFRPLTLFTVFHPRSSSGSSFSPSFFCSYHAYACLCLSRSSGFLFSSDAFSSRGSIRAEASLPVHFEIFLSFPFYTYLFRIHEISRAQWEQECRTIIGTISILSTGVPAPEISIAFFMYLWQFLRMRTFLMSTFDIYFFDLYDFNPRRWYTGSFWPGPIFRAERFWTKRFFSQNQMRRNFFLSILNFLCVEEFFFQITRAISNNCTLKIAVTGIKRNVKNYSKGYARFVDWQKSCHDLNRRECGTKINLTL